MQTIADRLKSALQQIQDSLIDANRDPSCVKLLAVSKTKPVSDIELAYAAGQRCFGENYVQEGVEKIQALQQLSDIEWHFIGPLQSNKTKLVAEHFDWFQALDRSKIAQRLNDQRSPHAKPLNVCIQVNINDETSKAGVTPEQVFELAEYIAQLPRLQLRGLMTIPAKAQNEQAQADTFNAMQALFTRMAERYDNIDTLSMGMSSDLGQAIQGGSTMVRIGTAIFGARAPKPAN